MDELRQEIEPKSLLTHAESLVVFELIKGRRTGDWKKFDVPRRITPQIIRLSRSKNWDNRFATIDEGDEEIIRWEIDNRVKFRGISVSVSSPSNEDYDMFTKIRLDLEVDGDEICSETINIDLTKAVDGVIPVLLSNPVWVVPQVKYTLLISFYFGTFYQQAKVRLGKQGPRVVSSVGLTLKFVNFDAARMVTQFLFSMA